MTACLAATWVSRADALRKRPARTLGAQPVCCYSGVNGRRTVISSRVSWRRFTYEEEATPEDFFVPLVWSLAVADLMLPWRHSAIVLFAASSGGKSTEDQSDASGTPRANEGSVEVV